MKVNLTKFTTCRHPQEHKWESSYCGIEKIAVSSDNTRIAFLSHESDGGNSVHVFSRTGNLIASTHGDRSEITKASLAFWPDDRHLLLVGDNPRDLSDRLMNLKLWAIGVDGYTYPFGSRFSWIERSKITSDGVKIFLRLQSAHGVLNTRSADFQSLSSDRTDSYSTWVFSQDGNKLAIGGYRSALFDLNTMDAVINPLTVGSFLGFYAFSPDNKKIITVDYVPGSAPTLLRIRAVPDLNPILELNDQSSEFSSAAYSPNGLFIITGHADGSLRVWDAISGACICHRHSVHLESIHSVLFSKTGYQIFTADRLDVMGWQLEVSE